MLSDHLSALVNLFNRGHSDLPDGVIHRECAFRLNGRAYHDTLGRPASDPLVRLIGCGPAGYRFVVAALRHAIPDAHVSLHPTAIREHPTGKGAAVLSARASLCGSLRGETEPFRAECELLLHGDRQGHLLEIAVMMGDADTELIAAARRRD